jgi:hypothetical protein
MIVVDRQKELASFQSNVTGGTYSTDTGQFIGLERNGRLVACVACTDCNGSSAQLHIGISERLDIDFLCFCFEYAFHQLKLKRIATVVDSSNTKSLKFSANCGFQTDHIIKDAGIDGDLHILTMYPHQCKLLNKYR